MEANKIAHFVIIILILSVFFIFALAGTIFFSTIVFLGALIFIAQIFLDILRMIRIQFSRKFTV